MDGESQGRPLASRLTESPPADHHAYTHPIDWNLLTRVPAKVANYELDNYFLEGYSQSRAAVGDQWEGILWRSALMLVKPDGIATGNLKMIREFLQARGFSVIGTEVLRFNRHMARALWRYQHASATPDRLAVEDLVLQSGPSLLLLLRTDGQHGLPASVHLSSLKGKADISQKAAGSLRDLLERPNRLFSMIHSADEPADLIRELNLLVDPAPRRRLLERLVSGSASSVDEALVDRVQSSGERGRVTLDRDAAVRRIESKARACATERPELAVKAGKVCAWLEATERGRLLPWPEFTQALSDLDVAVDVWDLAVVGSSHILADVPGATKVIGKPGPRSWLT